MATWFTSDLHFFHRNILKYCAASRPFTDAAAMNAVIIENWNSCIKPTDEVWVLGDVSFGELEPTVLTLGQLNGNKRLIIGNHDKKLLKYNEFRDCFISIDHYVEFRYNKIKFCLMHYPIVSWNERNQGSIMLHGHSHGTWVGVGRIKDVGIDTNSMMPYNLDEVYESLIRVPIVNDFGD